VSFSLAEKVYIQSGMRNEELGMPATVSEPAHTQAVGLQGSVATEVCSRERTPEVCGDVENGRYVRRWIIRDY